MQLLSSVFYSIIIFVTTLLFELGSAWGFTKKCVKECGGEEASEQMQKDGLLSCYYTKEGWFSSVTSKAASACEIEKCDLGNLAKNQTGCWCDMVNGGSWTVWNSGFCYELGSGNIAMKEVRRIFCDPSRYKGDSDSDPTETREARYRGDYCEDKYKPK